MQAPLPSRPLSAAISLATLCFATGSSQAWADALELTEMVVTASGYEQNLEDAPASITVLDGAELRKRAVHNLADAVRDVEGVVVNGGANETDIQIRGMPGDYTLILVDGKRQGARESRVNGNRGYEQSFIPPMAAIERIEVVRGPMSSLYGSDAIGGVINIITRKVSPEWGGTLSTDYSARQHSDQGNASNTQFYLNGPLAKDLLGLQLWGSYLNRQADDNATENEGFAKSDNKSLTARLALTPNERHDLLLEAGAERLTNGDGYSANWSTREQENNRDHFSLTHNGRWGWADSTLSFAQETTRREGKATPDQTDVYGRKPEVRNRVFDAKLVMPTEVHTTTAGLQWNEARLTDWNQANRGTAQERSNVNYAVVQKALFAEDEWRLTDDFALTTGVRLDHHDQYGNHVSPRLYGVWHLNPQWTLKGGVARGFKAPELRAVIDDYAVIRRNRFVMFGNSSLKPETSTNYELSAMWSNRDDLSAGATVFYNDFKDKLSTVTTTENWQGLTVMDRVNVDKAVIRGLELNGSWQALPTVAVKGNFTYLDSEQKSGANEGAPLALTPKRKAGVRSDWEVNAKTNAWAAVNYYGEEYQATVDAQTAPAYTTADLGVSYQLTKTLRLDSAIYNLTNKRLDDETYGTVNYGRTLWLGASLDF
jgi:outer membrane receptor for ferrienterochelin and colicins